MKFVFTKKFSDNLASFVHQKNRMRLIAEVIHDFQHHIFESKYYRKPLKGYQDIHELEVGGDVRIIVEILIKDDVVTFLNIGSHSMLGTSGDKKKKIR